MMAEVNPNVQALLSSIRDLLPGYQGYTDQSSAVQTDEQVRSFAGQQMEEIAAQLSNVAANARDNGTSSVADAIERVRVRLGVIHDGLLEEAGQEDEFHLTGDKAQRLYEYDLSILRRLAELRQEVSQVKVEEIDPDEPEDALTVVSDLLDGLSQDIFERDTLIQSDEDAVEY
ncbi:MAG: hypothetical protein GXO73_14290 [Calditrichaeota bacterium]|nr:hypothetical protein [Calditrichota bacterium]